MKLHMYAIHDGAVDAYGVPFFVANDAVASRSFDTLCSDDSSAIYHHPADFTLYHLGVYDDEIGSVISSPPRIIGRGRRIRPVNVEESSNGTL